MVPDLRFGTGYSDNLFITPDVLGPRSVSDGIASVSPRLRALLRLDSVLGLIGDAGFNVQKFFRHGDSTQASGTLFLGYRPVIHRHAELGIRGGVARVSEFPQNDTNEGHVFLSGTYAVTEASAFSGSTSIGLREFPRRSRTKFSATVLNLGPLVFNVPPATTAIHRGQEDVIVNAAGSFFHSLGPAAELQAAYDFTNNDSDFSSLDFRTHRASVGGMGIWSLWLATRFAYSASFRQFTNLTTASDSSRLRDDTIQTFSLTSMLTPKILAGWPLTRSGAIVLNYDRLVAHSNAPAAEFGRNFVSLALEIGFLPF